MKMKLFILFAVFSVMVGAQNVEQTQQEQKKVVKKESTNPFENPAYWVKPEYEGYPYQRAKHPVVYYDDGNKDNEILNFCGHQYGFDIEDITEECFLGPFIVSICIPPVCFLIVFVFLCLTSCITSCSRCCCGPCCMATDKCCCHGDGSRKAYKKKDWIIFMVITCVVVVCIQLPFFIIGIVGNASMTVALTDVTDSILEVYPRAKQLKDDFFTFINSIDTEMLGNVTDLVANDEDKKTVKTNGMNILKRSKKASKVKTADDDEPGDLFGELENKANELFDMADSIMYYVELAVDIIIIVREVLFDLILILPLIGGVLMLIGGIVKIHQLAISFFPCAMIFSFIAMIFVALEYPVATLIADGCVVYYNVINQADSAEVYEIKTLDDALNIFNLSTGEIINQVLLVLDDCENSILGDVKGVVNSIVDDFVNNIIEMANISQFMNLTSVCTTGDSRGMFYMFDGEPKDGGFKYEDCKSSSINDKDNDDKQNTACVHKLYNYSLNNDMKEEPLLRCSDEGITKNPANKLEELLNVLVTLKNIELSNTNVFWVNQTDLTLYMQKDGNGLDIEDIEEKYLELIKDYLEVLGMELGDDMTMKRSERKSETSDGISTAFCADVDGYISDEGSFKGKKLGENTDAGEISGYIMVPIACSPITYIPVKNCKEECPQLVAENFGEMSDILAAMEYIEEIRDLITEARNVIGDIADFAGCQTMDGIAEGIQFSVCQEYLEAETIFVVGLVAYSIVLWAMYIFGLIAVKRFNRMNYEYVDKSTRYYAEGEVEME